MKTVLIPALDLPDIRDVERVLALLPPEIYMFKVGLELFCSSGDKVFALLREQHKQIFLDLKLHDIPRTVHRATKVLARKGISWLTIHAGGGREMIRAAREAVEVENPAAKIIAVTVLTSLSQADLSDLGIAKRMEDQVLTLASLAIESGAHGLVCSPHEVRTLREHFGPEVLLVTPGIRPSTEQGLDDQKRTATVGEAVRAGASALVVGRPILCAPDMREASLSILREIYEAEQSG